MKNVIDAFRKIHGDAYDYSKVEYVNSHTHVTVICPQHGEFRTTPSNHKNGRGCKQCGSERRAKKKLATAEKTILQRFKATHGDTYDYSKVVYTGSANKVEIICPVHGSFYQLPGNHIKCGCHKCGRTAAGNTHRKTVPQLIEEFERVHQDKYDYSLVESVGTNEKVLIICKEAGHGQFYQAASKHLAGQGCPVCRYVKSSAHLRDTTETVIAKFKEVHGDTYSYYKVDYKTSAEKVEIVCPIHGNFWQTPNKHMEGCGCQICGNDSGASKQVKTCQQAVDDFSKVHGDTYDYSETSYSSAMDKVKVICRIHGAFWQAATKHLAGQGCPICANKESKAEKEIADFLEQTGTKVIRRDRELIKPKELDIVLPELNLAIEYNGLIWHSERFKADARRHMVDKQKACAEKGIRLLHINSNEDLTVIKRTLAVITGYDKERIFARKCKVEKLADKKQIDAFFNKHHIQGTIPIKGMAYGLIFKNQLIAIMAFSKPTSRRGASLPGQYELRRYSSLCRVPGGASRLLKAFLRDHPETTEIFSYSDNRWFTGGMYKALGFTKGKISQPSYQYIKGDTVYPKNHFTKARQAKRKDFIFDPDKTEKENCTDNGFYRIWDCGKTVWTLSP
jgi:G:T-mismatch repair DNA endonuclease (very short patch repair protein)